MLYWILLQEILSGEKLEWFYDYERYMHKVYLWSRKCGFGVRWEEAIAQDEVE